MKINNAFKLIVAVVVSELAGIIGSVFTTPSILVVGTAGIVKPALKSSGMGIWTGLDDAVCAYGCFVFFDLEDQPFRGSPWRA